MASTGSIPSFTALPDDPAALKAMIAMLMGRVDALELGKLRLEMELLRYKKWVYGPRADKLASLGDVAQMLLGFAQDLEARPVDAEDLAAEADEKNNAPPHTPRRVTRGKGRRNLAAFDNLPVTRHEHDLPETDKPCPCCGKMREKIGEELSWQIEFIPGRFERLEHVRFKYACTHCEQSAAPEGPQIVRADKPIGMIDKGLAGPGLLAFVATSKFSDYTPLYRLEDIFGRSGFAIARSTMSLWCRDMAQMVGPLYKLMVQRVLASGVIGTDDTVMPMLAPGEGKAKKARMWVYVGDKDNPYNVFDFTLSRSRDGPQQFLKGYKGTLLADAYGGYDGIVVGNGEGGIVRAGCWAHARRKFVDAEVTHPAIAAEAVGIIKKLYVIEDRGKTMDAASRGELRRSESAPILAALKDRLFAWRDQLLPKHPMAQAVGYTLNQWNELSVFVGGPGDGAHAGAVPIDNNASEREMKRIVLNRKNSLFAGNERGGRTAAILSSITSTCRRHDIDPQRYLTQLIINLPATPVSQLQRWLPDEWKRRDSPPPA
jgi:transposase